MVSQKDKKDIFQNFEYFSKKFVVKFLLFNLLLAIDIIYIYEQMAHSYDPPIIFITVLFFLCFFLLLPIRVIIYLINTLFLKSKTFKIIFKEKDFKIAWIIQKLSYFGAFFYWASAFASSDYMDSDKNLSPLFKWIVYMQEIMFR